MSRFNQQRIQTYIVLILLLLIAGSHQVGAQEPNPETSPAVEATFNALSPNERVGQLFMVSFRGSDVGSDSEIANLIQEYRIGGVVLSADNRNFVNNETTPTQVLTLTNALQSLAIYAPDKPVSPLPTPTPTATLTIALSPTLTQPVTTTTVISSPESYTPLPLFIAVSHEGDGYPYTEIRGGLTDLPNQMALGATWDPENARLIGQVAGQELSLLGVNMLFGPSLDVLDNPRPELGASLGVRAFGGHPYWVGKMGRAYIEGVHQGSDNQILTIAKHFPGFGSSDRKINQGVPTILKSLDELRRKELLPFFRVTRLEGEEPAGVTDGLMTAHVRYRGLQGNMPISLDARNLPAILALKEIADWRQGGGLIVSAPLGVPAALEGMVTAQDNFPARRLAQDAFLAGSDLLLLTDFAFAGADPEAEITNIKNAIQFFREKYATDSNFQAAVDRSVRRIIAAKIKIYGNNLWIAEPHKAEEELATLAEMPLDMNRIAQAGVTLISPAPQEGRDPLPGPPQPDDFILIFTDDRLVRDCPDCPALPLIESNGLQKAILQLFGPEATGQIQPNQIVSLGFSDIEEALMTDPHSANTRTEALIEVADWIIFVMLDVDMERYPQSDAIKALLRNRYDRLRNKTLVTLAFNAPYFLDETEVSQVTAYYGLYSKNPYYLETAARLLFQQFEPGGASPVSIPAIGPLDLSPDPNQTIQLNPRRLIYPNGSIVPLSEDVGNSFDLEVGQGILFRTSPIVDKNGHPVPDGTEVNFFRDYPLEGLSLEPLTAFTREGVAEITILKERETPLQVRVSSDLAVQAEPFNIGPGILDTPTPTPTPTHTLTPTSVPSPTATETPSPTIQPTATPLPPTPIPSPTPSLAAEPTPFQPVNLTDLLFTLLGVSFVGVVAFATSGNHLALDERLRATLVAIALGLVGYIFYIFLALILFRMGYITEPSMHWLAPFLGLLFAIAGTILWYLKPGRILRKETD